LGFLRWVPSPGSYPSPARGSFCLGRSPPLLDSRASFSLPLTNPLTFLPFLSLPRTAVDEAQGHRTFVATFDRTLLRSQICVPPPHPSFPPTDGFFVYKVPFGIFFLLSHVSPLVLLSSIFGIFARVTPVPACLSPSPSFPGKRSATTTCSHSYRDPSCLSSSSFLSSSVTGVAPPDVFVLVCHSVNRISFFFSLNSCVGFRVSPLLGPSPFFPTPTVGLVHADPP